MHTLGCCGLNECLTYKSMVCTSAKVAKQHKDTEYENIPLVWPHPWTMTRLLKAFHLFILRHLNNGFQPNFCIQTFGGWLEALSSFTNYAFLFSCCPCLVLPTLTPACMQKQTIHFAY